MSESSLFNKFGRNASNGQVIFAENEDGDQMYIIKEGSVKISKMIAGKEHILAILNKGDFFGEMAIVSRIKRTAKATAVGDVELLAFNREGFITMIEKNARIGINVIDKLCRRLERANEQIKLLVKKDIKSLIAMNLYYLCQSLELCDNLYYDKVTDKISKNMELPVNIIQDKFEVFRKKGIIEVSGNKIIIKDLDRLKNFNQERN